MIYFILGFSITLNVLFIIITFVVVNILKKKKSFFDVIDNKMEYNDFFK